MLQTLYWKKGSYLTISLVLNTSSTLEVLCDKMLVKHVGSRIRLLARVQLLPSIIYFVILTFKDNYPLNEPHIVSILKWYIFKMDKSIYFCNSYPFWFEIDNPFYFLLYVSATICDWRCENRMVRITIQKYSLNQQGQWLYFETFGGNEWQQWKW